MPCYYPHAHLHSSWTSPCPPPLPRPGPPFLITIPLKQLLLSVNDHVPCPLSPSLLFRGLLSVSPLFPSSVIAPATRAWASNWPPSPLPLGGGARGHRTDPHLPPFFLDFLPMKCLVLNYSHPTLIVIDWNSRGSGRMTDRLGSLRACPPRRRARGGGGRRRKRRSAGKQSHTWALFTVGTVAGQIGTRAAFKLPIIKHWLVFKVGLQGKEISLLSKLLSI